jgi:uncharacterized Zn-binding protein involved in type VI secretion
MHVCPAVTGIVPHVGGPVLPPGMPTVLIGGMPAARVGDMCVCVGPPDVIAKGSAGVFIGGPPAARIGDNTAHGGVIVMGFPTVLIGEVGGGSSGASNTPSGKRADLKAGENPKDPTNPEVNASSAGGGGGGGGGAGGPSAPGAGAPGAGDGPPPGLEQLSSAEGIPNPEAQAAVLQQAAESGTPLVQHCPAAG